jgi:hypothetical protein
MGQETAKSTTSEEKKREPTGAAWVPVWVALVSGIVTIIVALISSPLLEKWLEPQPTPSATPSPLVSQASSLQTVLTGDSTATLVEILPPVETSTPEMVVPSTPTPSLLSVPATPTLGLANEMYVIIAASQTAGKAPLTVKFDARGSYLRAADGTIFECSRGACRYSWDISSNGPKITKPDTSSGTLEFKFEKKGIYSISVYICHGATNPTCGSRSILVIVN